MRTPPQHKPLLGDKLWPSLMASGTHLVACSCYFLVVGTPEMPKLDGYMSSCYYNLDYLINATNELHYMISTCMTLFFTEFLYFGEWLVVFETCLHY